MGTENVIMEENEWRGGAGIIVSYWHCYCAVSVYRRCCVLRPSGGRSGEAKREPGPR